MSVETVIAINLNLLEFLRVETLFALILGQLFSQCFSISDRLICSDLRKRHFHCKQTIDCVVVYKLACLSTSVRRRAT